MYVSSKVYHQNEAAYRLSTPDMVPIWRACVRWNEQKLHEAKRSKTQRMTGHQLIEADRTIIRLSNNIKWLETLIAVSEDTFAP